jgi:hypothetical protein
MPAWSEVVSSFQIERGCPNFSIPTRGDWNRSFHNTAPFESQAETRPVTQRGNDVKKAEILKSCELHNGF